MKSPEGIELATLVLDLGYKLADRTRDLTRDQINFLMAALSERAERAQMAQLVEEGVTRIIVKEDQNQG